MSSRVVHIVLLKVRQSTDRALVDALVSSVTNLKAHIPQILSISCGPNFTDRSKGYTHALVVELPTRDCLTAYLEHPEHVRVRDTYIKPIVEDVLALDYETATTV